MNTTTKPLPTTPHSLFPTMGTLNEVVEYADANIPITNKNVIFGILMVYHNTLLNLLKPKE